MAAKNRMGKTRKPGDPYVTLRDPASGWTYEVLKMWQVGGVKPYARAFCNVKGFAEEMGDVYVTDLGTQLVDYDREVFSDSADALAAIFGDGGRIFS